MNIKSYSDSNGEQNQDGQTCTLASYIGLTKELKILQLISGTIVIILSILIMNKQQKKVKFIKKSDPCLIYADTYCKPFYVKVKLIIYSQGIILISGIINSIFGIIVLFKEDLISTNLLNYFALIPFQIQSCFLTIILSFQFVEYFAILYMIYTQSKRSIDGILYDFNNEPVSRPISKD